LEEEKQKLEQKISKPGVENLKEKEKEINLLLIGAGLIGGTICLIFVCCWRHAVSKHSQLEMLLQSTEQTPRKDEKDKKLKKK